jgi:ABC-type transport system substrate-binding protein
MRALRQRAAKGDYDGYLGGWIYSIKDLRPVFGSDFTYPNGANVVFYKSEKVDDLFDEIDRADDWSSLDSLLQKLQTEIASDQPYTFLYESKRLAVHGPRVKGAKIEMPSDPLAHLEYVWVD